DRVPPSPVVSTLPTVIGECPFNAAPVLTPPAAMDLCQGPVSGTTTDTMSFPRAGTYAVTWRYDDGVGNVSTQRQSIEVRDTQPPSLDGLPAVVTAEQADRNGTPVAL